MIKSKQRMDFNMTSNHQKNIPPKKTDSEPSKATESKSAKAPGTASPKEADARSSAKSSPPPGLSGRFQENTKR